MRLAVCGLGLWLFACGKFDSGAEPSMPVGVGGERAASGGNASAGGSASGGDNASGGEFTDEGDNASGGMANGGSSVGGRAPSGGGGGAVAGAAGSGGSTPSANNGGEASGGTAGSGGSPLFGDDEKYDACGCGCCGAPMQSRCYYPELGENLIAIKTQDQAARSSPGCANAGCAAGVHYVRCETPEVQAGATYNLYGYADSRPHLMVRRTTLAGRCTGMTTVDPGSAREGFHLELPGTNVFQQSVDGTCDASSTANRLTIGALGFMKQAAPHSCAFDFDFTLFFLADDGRADAARFKAEGIALPGMAENTCP